MKNIIGITGLARSGKDTFTKFLCEETGYYRYALAHPIKNTVNILFGWDDRHSDGSLKEEVQYTRILHTSTLALNLSTLFEDMDYGATYARDFTSVFSNYCVYNLNGLLQYKISPRKAYQLFGTEFGRRTICDSVWLDMIPDNNLVISDVRFDNEAEYIIRNGWRIVEIVSNRSTTKESSHDSEKGIDKSLISATITNNGTMEELKEKAKEICLLLT